jgi:hypothetical protein
MFYTFAPDLSVISLPPVAAMGNPGGLSIESVCAYDIEIRSDRVLLSFAVKPLSLVREHLIVFPLTKNWSSRIVSTPLSDPYSRRPHGYPAHDSATGFGMVDWKNSR